MKTASIDSIVRNYLFDKELPIHYYVRCLNYALNCAQELSYDTLPTIKSAKLQINEFGEATIPDDYVDYIKVGVEFGQYIVPLIYRPSINRLPNLNDQDVQIPYPEEGSQEDFGLSEIWNYAISDSSGYGYSIYGVGHGVESDVFNVIPERNVFQVYSGSTNGSYIHLQYLGFDETTATSTISKYAESTIKAYINWQMAERVDRTPVSEKMRLSKAYYNQLRILRGRLNPLDKETILRIIRRNFKQSVKT